MQHAFEKFERLEFPQYSYRLDYEPDIEFSLCGEEVECDIAEIEAVDKELSELERTIVERQMDCI